LHVIGQRHVDRFERKVPLARVKPDELTSLLGQRVTNRTQEHWEGCLEGVDHARRRRRSRHLEFDLTLDVREHLEVGRKDDPDHANVCTSTDNTAGRSRTIGSQESPELADA